jgi:hypothetical protein
MSSDYASGITESELKILNQALEDYLMKLETREGPQSEIDEVEVLRKKLNREESIRQDLMDASEADACEGCDLENCPMPCLESLGDRGSGPVEFTESAKGYRARERWARAYDDLNGAPESDDDR